ncbi:MAG: biotin--[Ruminococcus sp.]|nr:biotin--[acetyl-CoA-carboxylase] ligase [Ruminococcus sp.]
MKDKILELMLKTDGYISGQSLAEQLGVSRQAVWKAVSTIKEQGYGILSVPNKGYRLEALPRSLNKAAVKRGLKTRILGREIIVLDSVGSTNDYLKSLGGEDCESGTVVAAREQLHGKGRMGRGWSANKDECLMFSVLLRPQIAPGEVAAVTPLAGLAVCNALRKATGLDCRIKWPNDIIIGNKKLCGILTEMSAEFDAVEYVVSGIGVNVAQKEFPEEIADKATSLAIESGKDFDQNKLFAEILNEMEKVFTETKLSLESDALNEYISLCTTIGRTVSFRRGSTRLSGTAVDISSGGELRVMLPDGTICSVNSGEVTVQGIY